MRIASILLIVVTVGSGALFASFPELAHACSCPDCDLVRDSEIIVGGRVLSWAPAEPPHGFDSSTVVNLAFRTEQVFKGDGPRELVVFEGAIHSQTDGTDRWLGPSSSCGRIEIDPTGYYFVLGLTSVSDGRFSISGPAVFFMGPEPEGELYSNALAYLSVLGSPRPPSAGNSPPAAPTAIPAPLLIFVGAVSGLLLMVDWAIWSRRAL